MKNLKRIYLYRHGETNLNVEGITMGQLLNLDTKFTKKGYKQITEIGKKMRTLKVEVIYTSDFERTYQTANIVSKNYNVPVIITEMLRGLNMGIYQGQHMENFFNSEDVQQCFHNHNLAFKGGESINQLNNRIIKFILYVCKNSQYNNIALITHSAVISNLKSHLSNEPYCSLKECSLVYKNNKLEVIDYCTNSKNHAKRKVENEI